jgi:hypothetical protein
MRDCFKTILILILPVSGSAQQLSPDSLRKIYSGSESDSVRYKTAAHLYDHYEEINRDSAFFYADRCVDISRKNNKKLNEAFFLTRKAYQELNRGHYAESLHSILASFAICETKDNDRSYWNAELLQLKKKNDCMR